jgi:hypothetical protein
MQGKTRKNENVNATINYFESLEKFLKSLSENYKQANDPFFGFIISTLCKIKFYINSQEKQAISDFEQAFKDMNNRRIYTDPDLYVNYGNLIRNYLKKFELDKYKQEKGKKEYRKYFEKGVEKYQEAQKNPNKQRIISKDLSNEITDKLNDFSFLGEALMYSNELELLIKESKSNQSQSDAETFKKKMEAYEKRILAIVDQFEKLSDEGKIYISDCDEKDSSEDSRRLDWIKRKLGNILIRLLEMKSSENLVYTNDQGVKTSFLTEEGRLSVIKKVIKLIENLEYNIYQILKSHRSMEIESWHDFKSEELKLIVSYLKKAFENSTRPLYTTFLNLVNSMIFYGQICPDAELDTINPEVARKYCEQYRTSANDELHFNVAFYNFIFQFVIDLQQKNRDNSLAKEHLESCQEKCIQNLDKIFNPNKYKYKEFYLGNERGIKAIVPSCSKNKNPNYLFAKGLMSFKGNLIKDEKGYYKIIKVNNDLLRQFEIRVGNLPSNINEHDQSARYFNLAFARDNLIAENIKNSTENENYQIDYSDYDE